MICGLSEELKLPLLFRESRAAAADSDYAGTPFDEPASRLLSRPRCWEKHSLFASMAAPWDRKGSAMKQGVTTPAKVQCTYKRAHVMRSIGYAPNAPWQDLREPVNKMGRLTRIFRVSTVNRFT